MIQSHKLTMGRLKAPEISTHFTVQKRAQIKTNISGPKQFKRHKFNLTSDTIKVILPFMLRKYTSEDDIVRIIWICLRESVERTVSF